MVVLKSVLLVLSAAVLSVLSVPPSASAAAAKTASPAPVTAPATAVPMPTPVGRTPLTESHEFQYELTSGVGRLIVNLMWPFVCLIALLCAADIARRWLATRGADDAPAANTAVARAVTANAQFSLPATDLARVNAAAQTLAAQFLALLPNAPPSPMAMLAQPVPAGAPVMLTDARAEIEQYAERVFSVMVSSQYGLLALTATRALTYGEAMSMYSDARVNGYSATISTWLDVLVRTGLLRSVAAGAPVNTVVTATDLGHMFLGWCDAQGYGKVAFARLGRDV